VTETGKTLPDKTLPDIPIVDAHQHFWDLTRNYYPWLCDEPPIPFRYGDYSAIRRNYLPDDLRRDSAGLDLRMTVHMEAEWDRATAPAETRWLETVNAATGLPTACIGHAEFERANIQDVLAAHATSKLMRGIRQKPAAAASPADAKRGRPGSMDDPAWRDGYALMEKFGLSYDLQTPWWHLDAAAELAADFPRTTIIVNHTGLPADRSPEGIAAWRAALERVAARSNVAIKISGLGRRGLPWTVEANGPIVRDTIAVFGADRCMFASNFPVDSLAGSYRDIFAGFFAAVADRPETDRLKLFHDNAVRVYRLA
jgi:predicted TIM-barrel fold metal-dependent hydrolase